MFAVIIAVFFAGAAVFAIMNIIKSFANGAEKLDALFSQYRGSEVERPVRGEMKPAVRFVPAPAPDFTPRNVITMQHRSGITAQFKAGVWRAAA